MSKQPRSPMQPIICEEGDLPRFKKNAIVLRLSKTPQVAIHELMALPADTFPREDWEQLFQLLGYPVHNYRSLAYVREETADAADRIAAVFTRSKK